MGLTFLISIFAITVLSIMYNMFKKQRDTTVPLLYVSILVLSFSLMCWPCAYLKHNEEIRKFATTKATIESLTPNQLENTNIAQTVIEQNTWLVETQHGNAYFWTGFDMFCSDDINDLKLIKLK